MAYRKPVQLSALPRGEDRDEVVYVLCDDGSIWYVTEPGADPRPEAWRRLPDIPCT